MRGGTRLPRRGSARSARPRTFASRGSLASKPLRERVGRRGFLAIHDASSKRFRLSVCARAPDRALAPFLLVSPVPRSQRLPDACFARLLRTRSTLLFGRLPLFRSSSASALTAWPISEKAAPPAPERTSTLSRARVPAISGHQTAFWHEIHPTLRERDARAQQKPRSAESAQAKARQRGVGACQNAVWWPEIDVFPARETTGRARRPPPESSARPQTPRRHSAVLFAICRLPPAKGAPFAATSLLRLPLRAEAPRSGKRGVRDGRPFDGCASRRAQPLSHSTCGSSCSAGAVSPPTMRVSGTVPAGHQAAPSGRQTRLRSTPFRATAHAFHTRARPIGTLCGSTAAPALSASAPPASLWP